MLLVAVALSASAAYAAFLKYAEMRLTVMGMLSCLLVISVSCFYTLYCCVFISDWILSHSIDDRVFQRGEVQ